MNKLQMAIHTGNHIIPAILVDGKDDIETLLAYAAMFRHVREDDSYFYTHFVDGPKNMEAAIPKDGNHYLMLVPNFEGFKVVSNSLVVMSEQELKGAGYNLLPITNILDDVNDSTKSEQLSRSELLAKIASLESEVASLKSSLLAKEQSDSNIGNEVTVDDVIRAWHSCGEQPTVQKVLEKARERADSRKDFNVIFNTDETSNISKLLNQWKDAAIGNRSEPKQTWTEISASDLQEHIEQGGTYIIKNIDLEVDGVYQDYQKVSEVLGEQETFLVAPLNVKSVDVEGNSYASGDVVNVSITVDFPDGGD